MFQILLNGVDLRELRLSWLRRQIGLVGQEPVLFNTTIAKNICGDLDISYEDMISAAKDANVHDFITSLPEVSNRCMSSAGDKFWSDHNILIFDSFLLDVIKKLYFFNSQILPSILPLL